MAKQVQMLWLLHHSKWILSLMTRPLPPPTVQVKIAAMMPVLTRPADVPIVLGLDRENVMIPEGMALLDTQNRMTPPPTAVSAALHPPDMMRTMIVDMNDGTMQGVAIHLVGTAVQAATTAGTVTTAAGTTAIPAAMQITREGIQPLLIRVELSCRHPTALKTTAAAAAVMTPAEVAIAGAAAAVSVFPIRS